MHYIPHPMDQADTLMSIAQARGWTLERQEALEVIAQLQGFNSWEICSTVVDSALKSESALKPRLIVDSCDEKEGKELFVSLVTMEATMSAVFGVWAEDEGEAHDKLIEFAADRYQMNGGSDFEYDDGNYRDVDDFYLPDASAIENRTGLAMVGDDKSSKAFWGDEKGEYTLRFKRNEPDDCANGGPVAVTLTALANLEGASVLQVDLSSEQATLPITEGELQNQLISAVEEGQFDRHIEDLLNKAERALKLRTHFKSL